MENRPGISWGKYKPEYLCNGKPLGTSCRINLLKTSKGWFAIYYDGPEDKKGEVIKIFNPKSVIEYHEMLKRLAEWNYMTCELCPIVKMEMDGIS